MTTEGISRPEDDRDAPAPESQAKQYSVFIVDDAPLLREGVRAFLAGQRELVVIGEASSASSALVQMQSELPDLVIMNVSEAYHETVLVMEHLKKQHPLLMIVAFLDLKDSNALQKMVKAGAISLVMKSSSPGDLLKGIRYAIRGVAYIDPRLGDSLLAVLRKPADTADPGDLPPTEREEIILKLTARGYYSKEIGAQLNISPKTVDTHKARAMSKLGLHSRIDLIRFAQAQGWLEEA